jgi:hypothetical protein
MTSSATPSTSSAPEPPPGSGSAPASSSASAAPQVTLPTALYLISVWALHARHHKVGTAQQTVLPLAALAVVICTFLGHWAVLAAGVVTAVTVAVGVAPTARGHGTNADPEADGAHASHNTHDAHGS